MLLKLEKLKIVTLCTKFHTRYSVKPPVISIYGLNVSVNDAIILWIL